jgi:SAM-dependent methyltransferase
MTDTITGFYTENAEAQWSRFDRYNRIEEYVLRRAFRRHLPPAPAYVADVGGGNGRHAFHLGELGYAVALCDVTPALVEDARRRNARAAAPLDSIELCDARSLPWPSESCDAAVVLGPMYCLERAADRARALGEVARILRPGAPAFFQFFQRVAGLRSLLEGAPAVAGLFDWRGFLRTGTFSQPHIPDLLRLHYFTTTAQARSEVRAVGFEIVEARGMDGPSPGFGQGNLAAAPERIVEQWGEIADELGGTEEYLATSTHLLLVARRPQTT